MKVTSGPQGIVAAPTVSFSFVVEGTTEPGTIVHCGERLLALKACSSPYVLGPLAPGLHRFYLEATNKTANAYSPLTSCTFTVAAVAAALAASATGCETGAGAPSATAPVVTSVTQSAARWREGSALARLSRSTAPPRGTTFGFTLNEAARRAPDVHPGAQRPTRRRALRRADRA